MTIERRIQSVTQEIKAEEKSRDPALGTVNILAVSKGQTIATIQQAYNAGLRDFGENYLQEALTKIQHLSHLPLCWHFIGAIQSNKTAAIAAHFPWVHTVDSIKIARRLNDARPIALQPLNVCIQVNLDEEENKAGITEDKVYELAHCMAALPHVRLRGLMCIPKQESDEKRQYESFLRLATLQTKLNQQLNQNLDTLSMGMTQDYIPAIRAGSTFLRLGIAIFKERHSSPHKELLLGL